MMLARSFRNVSLILAMGGCSLASWGCSGSSSIRISHAPTYSYMNDPDARAEVELWPALPGDAAVLARADDFGE